MTNAISEYTDLVNKLTLTEKEEENWVKYLKHIENSITEQKATIKWKLL